MVEIRSDPATISPAWLSEVLAAAGHRGAAVAAVSSTRVGTGQVGQCVRFQLAYEGGDPGPEAPRSLIGKFPSDDPQSRAAGVEQDCYVKEVGFYRSLRAELPIRTPRCYFAAIEDRGPAFTLLLEDLDPVPAGDQLAGCGVEVARAALFELTRLHAPRWGDPALATIPWLATQTEERSRTVQALYQMVLPGFFARYGDALSPAARVLCSRLGSSLAAWSGDRSTPRPVVHVDYRLDNLLIDQRRSPPRVTVVDWQTVNGNSALSDVAYFLGASITTELRRAHERELLAEYHEGLLRGGVRDYSWRQCFHDYRRGTFAGVLMAVVASMLVGRTERGDAMFVSMAQRHSAHALDLDADELLE